MNNANFLQALRGPLMLITLGILFAIDHFGPFSFGRTWPLLIIVFGILKLAERAVAPPEPVRPDAPPAGGMRP